MCRYSWLVDLEFLVIWLQSISLLLKASYYLPYSPVQLVLRLPRLILLVTDLRTAPKRRIPLHKRPVLVPGSVTGMHVTDRGHLVRATCPLLLPLVVTLPVQP